MDQGRLGHRIFGQRKGRAQTGGNGAPLTFIGGMDPQERGLRIHLFSDARNIGQANRWIDPVIAAQSPATQMDHRLAQGAGIDGGYKTCIQRQYI
jgi:hypothetical protein